MPLIHGLDGRIIPVGKVTRSLVEPFIPGTAFPAWLQATAGTASFSDVGTTRGYAQVATAAATSAQAGIQTTFDIATDQFREIRWTAESYKASHTDSGFTIAFALTGTNCGVNLMHLPTADSAVLRILNAGGNVDVPLPGLYFRGTEATKRRNITVALRPLDEVAFVIIDGQVMHEVDVSATFTNGDIRPKVTIANSGSSSVAHNLQVSQLKLDLIHN